MHPANRKEHEGRCHASKTRFRQRWAGVSGVDVSKTKWCYDNPRTRLNLKPAHLYRNRYYTQPRTERDEDLFERSPKRVGRKLHGADRCSLLVSHHLLA